MKFLLELIDKQRKHFSKDGKLKWLHPVFEATDTFMFTPDSVTRGPSHVRDGLDLKRMMTIVVVALIPCVLMALYNTGLQANLALNPAKLGELTGWRNSVIQSLGVGYSPHNVLACLLHGALYFLPVYIVTIIAGGFWEVLFAIVRKHDVNEGFLVTSLLIPLIVPPAIPLWQVAIGVSFGVVFGKEVFGGTGMNFLNPALVTRAFLFFAYPGQISGDKVWVATNSPQWVDGYSGATALGMIQLGGFQGLAEHGYTWRKAFLGLELGSMGETSALACLIGAVVLIMTRVGSWRTMAGICAGTAAMATFFNMLGQGATTGYATPFWWHMVLGGWAFGAVFMATDPVSSAFTDKGKWIYGFMIGLMVVLIRVVNPAYPEAMMLSILFWNIFAPLIDYYIVKANIKRRLARSGA